MAEEVINELLGYENLKIIQRPDMFHFSLDSTLLADFAMPREKTKRILDLGTGNAPVPLFLTLKTKAHITGIELQEEVYDLAKRSVRLNQLEDQIEILNEDIKGVHKLFENSTFDMVTCNPPFFKYKASSNTNSNEYKTIARHEVKVTLEEIIFEVKRVLKTRGSFVWFIELQGWLKLSLCLQSMIFQLKDCVLFILKKEKKVIWY